MSGVHELTDSAVLSVQGERPGEWNSTSSSGLSRRSLQLKPLRRRAVLVAGLGAAIAGLTRQAAARASESAVFYVSADGSDDADGSAPNTAWASTRRINAELPGKSVVLLRRGDTFYGEVRMPRGCELGAYGEGDRPTLTMFKLLNRPSGWTRFADEVWRIDLSARDTHDGYVETQDANIGYLVIDGDLKAAKKNALSELSDPWDFWCDIQEGALYVAAGMNPVHLASDIRAAPRGTSGQVILCVEGSNSIRDIHVTGTGGHGITGAGADVEVRGCLIDYIGGSYLPGYGNGMIRYGNGIENGIGAQRWLVAENDIAEVYDSAYTCQGNGYGNAKTWDDMTIRNNRIKNCTQSFEFWSTGSNKDAGFRRILVEGNVCERAGYSQFSSLRPNQDVRVHLLTYVWDLHADITIQNNVFSDAKSAYAYHTTDPVGLISKSNTIALKAGCKMEFQRAETVEEAGSWQEATGREIGSEITVLQ